MAQVLSISSTIRLWAVDKMVLLYLASTGALMAVYFNRLPDAWAMLTLNVAFAALIVAASRQDGRATGYFRYWYPLPVVMVCYRQMAKLIPAVRGPVSVDHQLAQWDLAIWHVNPVMWLQRVESPALTDIMQLLYALFVPAVLLVPWLLWRNRRFQDFRYCAFLIAAGFLVSYAGYIFVPARGPRFLFHEMDAPVSGPLVHSVRAGLDWLESAHYDCFPSGHTEMTIVACWISRLISRRLFAVYCPYTLCIIFATVYLRYHYTVDVLAGSITAAIVIVAAPVVYRSLGGEEPRGT